jgi:acetoin utilization protein AcuB
MRVRELMNRNLVTIAETSPCREAALRMHRARVRHLPVLDADGELVGVVTDRDLRHHLFSPEAYRALGVTAVDVILQRVAVREIMSAPPITTDAGGDVHDVARLMRERKVGALPVTERGRLVGIITETDLLREICRADAGCSPEVADIVVSHP